MKYLWLVCALGCGGLTDPGTPTLQEVPVCNGSVVKVDTLYITTSEPLDDPGLPPLETIQTESFVVDTIIYHTHIRVCR